MTPLIPPPASPDLSVAEDPTIYVVMGSTGEYSDRSEWPSKAFHTEAEARAFVDFLIEKRQQFAGQSERLDWDEREIVEESMRAFDPNYSEDYTGTRWWVSPVTLVTALREAAAKARAEGGL